MADKELWNIYIFIAPALRPGQVNVGMTKKDTPEERIKAKLGATATEGINYTIIEFRKDLPFTDHDVHTLMEKKGATKLPDEWFSNASSELALLCLNEIHNKDDARRTKTFSLYEEQQDIVDRVVELFNTGGSQALLDITPRTGKTFMSYHIAKEINAEKILILTAKPAAGDAWYSIAYEHVDFKEFSICQLDEATDNPEAKLHFVSKQWIDSDPERINYINKHNYEMLIWDESHYAKNTNLAQKLLANINRKYTLFLSGTPEEDLRNDLFAPHEIFRYSLLQQQMDKRERQELGSSREIEMPTPHFHIPMILKYHYDEKGYFDSLSFLEVKNNRFVHEKQVVKFLDYLSGYGDSRYPLEAPYNGRSLFEVLDNFMIFFERLEICSVFIELLQSHLGFGDNFNIIDLSKEDTNGGTKAIDKIKENFNKHPRNIIISCGKAGTGTTIPSLDCVIMLTNLKKSASYTQYALRCQSPQEGKENCYIIDPNHRRCMEMMYNIADIESTYGNFNFYDETKDFTDYVPVTVIDEDKMIRVKGLEILEAIEPPYTQSHIKTSWESDDLFNYTNLEKAEFVLRNIVINGKPASIPGLRSKVGKEKIDELLKQPLKELGKQLTKAGLRMDIDENNGSYTIEDADPKPIDIDEINKEKTTKRKQVAQKTLERKWIKLIKNLKTCSGRIPLYLYVSNDHIRDFSNVIEPEIFKDVTGIHPDGYNNLITLGIVKEKKVYRNIDRFFVHLAKHPDLMTMYYPKLSLPPVVIEPTDEPITILLSCEKMNGVIKVRESCPNAKIYYIESKVDEEDAAQKYIIARNAKCADAMSITKEEAAKIKINHIAGSPKFYDDNKRPIYITPFNEARALNADTMSFLLPAAVLTKKPHTKNSAEWWNSFRTATDITEIRYWRRGRDLIQGGTDSGIIMVKIQNDYNGPLTFINVETGYITQHNTLVDFAIPEGTNIKIVEKIINHPNFKSLSSLVMPKTAYGFASDETNVQLQYDEEHNLRLRCKKNNVYYVSIDDVKLSSSKRFSKKQVEDSINQYKVFVPKSMTTRGSRKRISTRYLGRPGEVCTETYYPISPTDKLQEAENLLTLLNTKTVEYLVNQKSGQTGNITASGFDWVPLMDLSCPWTDEGLFDYFNFNEFERQLIISDTF